MSDVSLLRFVNALAPGEQGQVLALVNELSLVESESLGLRCLESEQPRRYDGGSFAADLALADRRNRPIFRQYYKPDLSAFEPFYQQLELFPNG